MPRAMGLFRKAGFDAIAYPVAYRTPWQWDFDPARNLRIFEIAMREWIPGSSLIGRPGRIGPTLSRSRALMQLVDGVDRIPVFSAATTAKDGALQRRSPPLGPLAVCLYGLKTG